MADQIDKLANDLSNVKVENAVKTTFQWKVDVPEFVPRYMASSTAPSSNVPPSKTSYASIAGKGGNSFGAPNDGASDLANNDETSNVADNASSCSKNASFVNGLLTDLHTEPEDIVNISGQMVEYFNTQIFDDATLKEAIGCVIESALSVENFAYLCVRVTVLLHDNFSPAVENLNFRSCLLSVLQTEHEKRTHVIKVGDKTPRLYTFVYLLSELSSNLLIDGRPMKVLSKALYEVLDTILMEPTDDANVRFVIQTLKSVGAHLETVEREETNGQTPQMNEMIDRLERIGTMPNSNIKENTKFMIKNLRGVRRHWAYTAPTPAATTAAAAVPTYNNDHHPSAVVSNDIVINYANIPPSVVLDPSAFYFVPESLSAEEAAFFERECRAAGGGGSVSDNELGTSEDDAIADAYEEFLSSVQRK